MVAVAVVGWAADADPAPVTSGTAIAAAAESPRRIFLTLFVSLLGGCVGCPNGLPTVHDQPLVLYEYSNEMI
jgi:hypothetical protein